MGADGASSGFAASRGAGGGRGGETIGGAVFADGILRAIAADFGFAESGASGESNGLMALGMRAFVGPPFGESGYPGPGGGWTTPGGGRSGTPS